jgi:hypothetical protein
MRLIIRPNSNGAKFVHPSDPAPRTAVLAADFRYTKLTRVFPQGWNQRAARFAPAALAGPFVELFRAAQSGAHVEHSVVVFTYPGDPGLSPSERDWLWDAFGVPVFEQYLGPHSELVASECDAHAGLHVMNGHEDLDLEYDVCACGNRAPRITRGPRIDELASLLS